MRGIGGHGRELRGQSQFALAYGSAARSSDWGRLAYDCVAQLGELAGSAQLDFIYVTDALAGDLAAIVAFLKRTTSIADWVGSIGIGIVGGAHEYFDEPAMALLAVRLPPGGHCLISGASADPDAWRDAAAWAGRVSPVLGIVHADPRMPDLPGAIEVLARDTATFLVGGLASSRGWIAVGGEIAVGDPMLFVRRDREAAERDLVRMLAALRRRMTGPPRAGLYFSCIARGRNLFGPNSAELSIIRRELGDVPLAGLFCNGEISCDRLYSYTGVLALFV